RRGVSPTCLQRTPRRADASTLADHFKRSFLRASLLVPVSLLAVGRQILLQRQELPLVRAAVGPFPLVPAPVRDLPVVLEAPALFLVQPAGPRRRPFRLRDQALVLLLAVLLDHNALRADLDRKGPGELLRLGERRVFLEELEVLRAQDLDDARLARAGLLGIDPLTILEVERPLADEVDVVEGRVLTAPVAVRVGGRPGDGPGLQLAVVVRLVDGPLPGLLPAGHVEPLARLGVDLAALEAARPGPRPALGVLRHDAVLPAQPDDLLDQLLARPAQADLLEEVADLPGGPQRGQELARCLAGPLRQVRLTGVLDWPARQRAGDREGVLAALL